MGHTKNQMGAFTLAGSSGPVPTLPSFGPDGGNGARLSESLLFGLWGPDQAEHREVTELLGGVGPSTCAQTGGTLVGQPMRRVSGPSDGSVLVR